VADIALHYIPNDNAFSNTFRIYIFTCRNDQATYRPSEEFEALTWFWDVTTQADKEIITNNQLGVNSRFYKLGRLSEMEAFEQSFIDWYLSFLES